MSVKYSIKTWNELNDAIAGLGDLATLDTVSTSLITGTTTNDDAAAGRLGEYLTESATGVSLTSGSNIDVVSKVFGPGDYDVQGALRVIPAGSNATTALVGWIGTTATTIAASGQRFLLQLPFGTGSTQDMFTPIVRIKVEVGTTQTVYLGCRADWTTSTMTADGQIRYRRAR